MNESLPPQKQLNEHQNASPSTRFEHIKKITVLFRQRWPEYLIEVVVVILGITISFALSNFQTNAANNTLEESYLKSLHDDFSSDSRELKETIIQTENVIKSAQVILERSHDEQNTMEKNELIQLVRAIASRPNFVSKNATFSSLKNSVNLQLIRDLELRNLLFIYDQQYQALKIVEFFEGQEMITLIGPFILRNIPLDSHFSQGFKPSEVNRLLADMEFINHIILRADKRKELLETYQEILTTSRQIELNLKKKLKL
jgi:hypothetical protein